MVKHLDNLNNKTNECEKRITENGLKIKHREQLMIINIGKVNYSKDQIVILDEKIM